MQALLTAVVLASPVALPSASTASVAAAPPRAATAREETIDREKFLTDFRKAMEIKAKGEMAAIVRRMPRTATIVIIEICEAIARETNERLETEIAALQDAWSEAFSTRFAEITYEYFSLMRLQVRQFRGHSVGQFDKVKRDYDAAMESKNLAVLDVACESLEKLAEAFSNCGDHYYESECWYRVGRAYDTGVRGKDAKVEKAGNAYKKAVEAREEVDLHDWLHAEARARADQLLGSLKERAKKEDAAADEGFTRQVAGVALGPEETHDLEFELIEDIERFLRPGYRNHDLPVIWGAINLAGLGSKATFLGYPDGPEATRAGGTITFDVDRDGTDDTEVRLTGNIEPLALTLGSGDNLRQWGFLSTILTQQEQYQGIGISLEPQAASLSLYVAPAGSMVGTIGDTEVRVIDENLDGVYGSPPTFWSFFGVTEGMLEPVFDTLVVGDAKRAGPWSEYAEVGAGWYQLVSDQSGTRLKAAPAKIETGTLKVDYEGEEPLYLIVQGTGTFANSYYDVMANGKKGVSVPAGAYKLFCGELREGRRKQVMKALILADDTTKTWTVDPGGTTTMELGEPYDFDYEATGSEDTVTVKGQSMALVGRAGERYERLWNCTPEPEIFLRKVGTKKGGKSVRMDLIRDYTQIIDHGFVVAWFPVDTTIEKKDPGDDVELQLVEKKNKLFGKIESDWRPVP